MKLCNSRSIQVALFAIAFPVLALSMSGCKSANRDRYAALENEVDQSISPESLRPVIATDGTIPESTVVEPEVAVALVSTDMSADPQSAKAISRTAAIQPTEPAKPQFPTLHTLQSGENINEMISTAPGTVLVDFYADWCGPCKTQGKVLHRVEEFAAQNQARIIKVDVDAHKALAKQLDITTLPTLLVIKDGKVVERKVGLNREPQIREMLQ